MSSEADVDSGVPQGAVLFPLLILAFINDLPEVVNCSVKLFADDCLIYMTVNSPNKYILLRKDLSALEEWGGGVDR